MAIRKGSAWGQDLLGGETSTAVNDLPELARLAAASLENGEQLVAKAVGEDLLKTLGLTSPRSVGALKFGFDLGYVEFAKQSYPFVEHAVWRRNFWAQEFVVAMNVAWLGELYLGPKAHPNDGLLDISVGSLALRQRILARKRARTASHLPHPDLQMLRKSEYSAELSKPTNLWLDGIKVGQPTNVHFKVVPDAFFVVA